MTDNVHVISKEDIDFAAKDAFRLFLQIKAKAQSGTSTGFTAGFHTFTYKQKSKAFELWYKDELLCSRMADVTDKIKSVLERTAVPIQEEATHPAASQVLAAVPQHQPEEEEEEAPENTEGVVVLSANRVEEEDSAAAPPSFGEEEEEANIVDEVEAAAAGTEDKQEDAAAETEVDDEEEEEDQDEEDEVGSLDWDLPRVMYVTTRKKLLSATMKKVHAELHSLTEGMTEERCDVVFGGKEALKKRLLKACMGGASQEISGLDKAYQEAQGAIQKLYRLCIAKEGSLSQAAGPSSAHGGEEEEEEERPSKRRVESLPKKNASDDAFRGIRGRHGTCRGSTRCE